MTIAIGFHLLLLLALFFIAITTPIPPFPEEAGGTGALVDIGYVDAGTGNVQPLSELVTEQPVVVQNNTSVQEENYLTQDVEEANVSEKEKKNVDDKKVRPSNDVKVKTQKVEEPRKANPNALYPGKRNNSTSQGNATTGTGDQGDKNGDLSKYFGKGGSGGQGEGTGTGPGTGPGNGPGVSFDLKNRRMLKLPKVDDNSQETGKVTVAITVDKNGTVIAATPGVRPSTTTSAYLYGKAKEAALRTKFDVKADAPDIQKGTMTFVFVVQ